MTLEDLDEQIVRVVCEIEFCRSDEDKERFGLWLEAHDRLLALRRRKLIRGLLKKKVRNGLA